ncbi:MAG: tannase/feruloyl esterase family alpha/beta hydrolase [Lautropia sp.]|nr:tannase/feruloyl esterase family alpha/beta hydrolase [Lautropia sp.]
MPALRLLPALPGTALAAQDLPALKPVVACHVSSFERVSLPEAPARVTTARIENVDGKPMCMVSGVISPQIRFIVRLPVQGWTQRYLQTGCGGLCGRLAIQSPQRDCRFEQEGSLAMASTDMGHSSGAGGIWGAADMQLRVDFGYRGVHVTALIAKEVIRTYYGQRPRFSYFSGCSDGGREALMSAQRYPEDFDGIAAGAPSLLFLVQNSMYHGWNAHVVQPDAPIPAIAESDLPVLHRRALAQCDEADGLKDGLVSDPACTVDPMQWVCTDETQTDCLSPRTAAAAAAIYRGAHDGQHRLVVGSVLPGAELAWARVIVPQAARLQQVAQARHALQAQASALAGDAPPAEASPASTTRPAGITLPSTDAPVAAAPPGGADRAAGGGAPATGTPAMDQVVMPPGTLTVSLKSSTDIIPNLAFADSHDPDWRLADFRFTRETLQRLKPMHALLDASEPDLSAFHARGGRLLVWHGLADQHITPMNAIAYYQAVRDTLGQAATDEMMRLFLIPGMYHCGRGNGLGSVDVTTPLMDWVEDQRPPEVLMASANAADAAAGRGRNLHPFPFLSELKAGGKIDVPGDWQRGRRITLGERIYRDWAGREFFDSGFQQRCGFEGLQFVCHPARPAAVSMPAGTAPLSPLTPPDGR